MRSTPKLDGLAGGEALVDTFERARVSRVAQRHESPDRWRHLRRAPVVCNMYTNGIVLVETRKSLPTNLEYLLLSLAHMVVDNPPPLLNDVS